MPSERAANGGSEPTRIQVTRVRQSRRPDWRPRFLEHIRLSGNVSAAAQAAGINRATPYVAANRDPAFAAAWEMAREEAVDALEAEARRRAMAGSDRLLEFLLRGQRPERYRRDEPDVRREIRREIERVAARIGISIDEVFKDVEDRARELDR